VAKNNDGGQQRMQPRRDEDVETEETTEASKELKERQDKLADDVDAMLDEIDEALEENAEEFVRGFVQKGGQ
jgi:prokaryotic ubiquitin-like protein Pup